MENAEKQMLRESLERFAREKGGMERRLQWSSSELGFDPSSWRQFAENGWLGAMFAEQYGGFGGGAAAMAIIMESIGYGLLLEPYLACVVLGGGMIERIGTEHQKQQLLGKMIDGEIRLALAFAEPRSGYDLGNCKTLLSKSGEGYVLNGQKIAVVNGDSVDTFLVTARIARGSVDRNRLVIAVVPRAANGVTVSGYATVDGLRGCNLGLSGVRVDVNDVLGDSTVSIDSLEALENTIDSATTAVCAEALGAMSALLAVTVDYLKTRKQFGRPLADNQALQHRVVDMYIALEESRVLVADAVRALEGASPAECRSAVSAAKVQVGSACRLLGQEAVQLHGAIGTTAEYVAGSYFKRLTVIGSLFGNRSWHLRRFMQQEQKEV